MMPVTCADLADLSYHLDGYSLPSEADRDAAAEAVLVESERTGRG